MFFILNVKNVFRLDLPWEPKVDNVIIKNTVLLLKEAGTAEKWVISRLCHSLWPWSGCIIL